MSSKLRHRISKLPNVRLVNGAVKSETRQHLMLSFNSPLFTEILIASSVMAEGVDLHRFCRYVIHHDLYWNPSSLEQRTGRVDRIGAKVERCGQPIRMDLRRVSTTGRELVTTGKHAAEVAEKYYTDGGETGHRAIDG